MPYRSAILSAVEDLKDHQTGSSASSIRRHIKEHDTVFADAMAASDDDTTWNETLFQTTLKSLVSKGVLCQVNGSNYKFTDSHLERRAGALRERAESIEERQRAARAEAAAHRAAGAAREDPPKDSPKRKTVHAKVKMNEARVITVVNPEGGGKSRGDEMETDDEVRDVELKDGGKPEGKRHVKIIPRKVVGTKKMCVPSGGGIPGFVRSILALASLHFMCRLTVLP